MKAMYLSMLLILLASCGETPPVSDLSDVLFQGQPKHQNLKMVKMADGTISWEQPNSTGVRGYNGYCGETAWANIASMYLNKKISPFLFYKYATGVDATPGTQLETLQSGLENITKKTVWSWKKQNAQASSAILELEASVFGYGLNRRYLAKQKKLRKRYPVIVLIAPKQNSLHWVTVVDVITDNDGLKHVVFNEYGTQKSLPAKTFFQQWDYSNNKGLLGKVISVKKSFGKFAYIAPKVVKP